MSEQLTADPGASILTALWANATIAAVKLGGAVFTGSGALLAEACHSVADTGNEALLLLGRKQARSRPSARHPLGQGRATYFWSFVVTLLLFSVGGIFSIVEGVARLITPRAVDRPWLAAAIILFALAAEGFSLWTATKQIAVVRGQRTLWRWFKESRHSELIVILGEDLTAVAGLCLAIAALALTIATGNSIYDAVGSVCIGLLLIVVATALAIEIKSLLIGESASPKTLRALREFLNGRDEIAELTQLVTLQHGDDLVVAVQARMKRFSSARELTQAIADCKEAIHEKFPQATWIFFEPVEGALPSSRGGLHTTAKRSGKV